MTEIAFPSGKERDTADQLYAELGRYLAEMPYRDFLKSNYWSHFRRIAIHHYGTCGGCDNSVRLEVHHISYENRGRETLTDVRVLCRKCHAKYHDRADA